MNVFVNVRPTHYPVLSIMTYQYLRPIQCCGVNIKVSCDLYLAELLWKIITKEEKVSESQAATEQSSVAPPASVQGSFALDERLSLCLSTHHLNINLLP